MKIWIINGPNLNMLGVRERVLYGNRDYRALEEYCRDVCRELSAGGGADVECEIFQSNHEGELVDVIQQAHFAKADGIVINPAAYTHTSVAILDALKAVGIRTVEVHITDVDEREEFRKISYIRAACEKTISGRGTDGYLDAMDFLTGGHADAGKD